MKIRATVLFIVKRAHVAAGAVWLIRAELLTAATFVVGWLLITKGIAKLTRPEVWPISIGLLLLSLCGWGFIRTVVVDGLYLLRMRALSVKKHD